MNNFSVKVNGKEYWISRSVAVVGYVHKQGCILAIQRGKGTPDPEFVGKWCLPCGYLDYDETCWEAVKREIHEETGILINENNSVLNGTEVNSDPKADKRQNVTVRYKIWYCGNDELSTKFSEKNEVSDIKWIPIDEVDNYEWAFNHKELIKDYNDDIFNS